jgi:hypothetical protein
MDRAAIDTSESTIEKIVPAFGSLFGTLTSRESMLAMTVEGSRAMLLSVTERSTRRFRIWLKG